MIRMAVLSSWESQSRGGRWCVLPEAWWGNFEGFHTGKRLARENGKTRGNKRDFEWLGWPLRSSLGGTQAWTDAPK